MTLAGRTISLVGLMLALALTVTVGVQAQTITVDVDGSTDGVQTEKVVTAGEEVVVKLHIFGPTFAGAQVTVPETDDFTIKLGGLFGNTPEFDTSAELKSAGINPTGIKTYTSAEKPLPAGVNQVRVMALLIPGELRSSFDELDIPVATVTYVVNTAGTFTFDETTLLTGQDEDLGVRFDILTDVGGSAQTAARPYTVNAGSFTTGGAEPTETPTEGAATPTPTNTMLPNQSTDVGTLVLDSFGGIHALGTAGTQAGVSYTDNAPYWTSPGIAVDLALDKGTPAHALIVDMLGGVHYVNWTNAFDIVSNTQFYFVDAVSGALHPDGDGAYVLDKYGNIHESGYRDYAGDLVLNNSAEDIDINGANLRVEDDPSGYYVDIELSTDASDNVIGYYLLDQRGMVIASEGHPRPLTAQEQANLDPMLSTPIDEGWAAWFVDLEVLTIGDDTVFVTLRSDGTVNHSMDDLGTADIDVLGDGTDLNDLPFLGGPDMARDMEYQTAAEGGTSANDPSASGAGVVMLDAFGRLYATQTAEIPVDMLNFGARYAASLEVADF